MSRVSTRQVFVYIHIVLAAFFLPLLLNMPVTGALYLLGYQGSQTKTEAFKIPDTLPADKSAYEAYFREQFKAQGVDFDFEYIRETPAEFVFRPTTRAYYTATRTADGQLAFSRVEPDLLKRLVELHKGHGSRAMRGFEIGVGIALTLTILSGLWLALSVRAYRRIALVAFGVGVLAIVALAF